jgi:hypothetical protein
MPQINLVLFLWLNFQELTPDGDYLHYVMGYKSESGICFQKLKEKNNLFVCRKHLLFQLNVT